MKKSICLFLSCLFCVIAFAQDFEDVQLQQKLTQHPQQDTVRVNLLNRSAQKASMPAGKRDTVATEALVLSQKLNYKIGEGAAFVNLSSIKLQQGNRQEATRHLQAADSILAKAGNEELLIRMLVAKSNLSLRVDNKKALSYAEEAEAKALKTGDKRLLSYCQNRISALYGTSLNDYPKAIEYGLKAVLLYKFQISWIEWQHRCILQ